MKTSVSEKAKVAVMLCGHREYWPQFDGLKERLIHQGSMFAQWVAEAGVEVVEAPFVDTVEDAYSAGVRLKSRDIDLLFVYLTSYVASGRFMQGALAADCPIVIVGAQTDLNFSGKENISIFETIASGGLTPLAESYNAFVRCGKTPAGMIFGLLDNSGYMHEQIAEWCAAANAAHAFKGSIFGSIGHTYEGMLDMNYDPTWVTRWFGGHVRFVEMCELMDDINTCTDAELKAKMEQINNTFVRMNKSYDTVTQDIQDADLEWAAKVSVGVDKVVKANNLSGLAYYYIGNNDSIYERAASNMTIANSLMTTSGISMAGEADMKTCLAMYMTSAMGGGGSFCEFNSCDFHSNIVNVGHDGPHDIRISDKKPCIRGLGIRHGKQGTEVSVEFSIKHGSMTMVAVTTDDQGKCRIVYAEGQSMAGWVPQNGNTVTRGYFGEDVAKFIRDWSCAGQPTDDPSAAATLVPFSEHKGYAIATVVEAFSALLSGGCIGNEIHSMYGDPDKPNEVSHCFMAMCIDAFRPLAEFKADTDAFIEYLHARPRIENKQIFYPGEIENSAYEKNSACGISLPSELFDKLKETAYSLGVDKSCIPNIG